MRKACTVAALAGVMASLVAGQERPSFVVILSDDQSWVGSSVQIDHTDRRTKSDYFQTPSLERLARSGITFTDGYAPAPFCCPTRRSIQVGQTPARHLYQRDQEAWPVKYRRQLNIPNMLKQADPRYRSAHFGKWDHRFDMPTPNEMGYDASDGYTSNRTGGGKGSGGPSAVADPKLIDHITDQACEFMERQALAGAPFYLQVSHYAVHLDIYYRQATLDFVEPWKPGKKHYMPEFAAMTADMDTSVGRALDKIQELGLKDTTYVIFLSDNGGRATLPGAGDPSMPRNHPLRGAKGSMYEGGIRVPFFVVGPGITPGSVSRTPVTGLDILPTIAELSGYSVGSLPETLDGGSMAPLLRGESGNAAVDRSTAGMSRSASRRALAGAKVAYLVFHQAVGRRAQSALRLGRWKLVKTWASELLELFDLSEDVGETRNLAKENSDQARRLHALLTRFLDDVGAETRKTED